MGINIGVTCFTAACGHYVARGTRDSGIPRDSQVLIANVYETVRDVPFLDFIDPAHGDPVVGTTLREGPHVGS